jgi:predicted exporter
VLYVFVPLMLSAVVFLVYSALTRGQMNIIHFVGFSLVIALATDYASVAMSVDHHDVEMSKILLTALSTLGTFGVLLLAEHPVMRDLGWTVTIGCVVAAVVALFVKLRGEGAAQSESEPEQAARPREAA